jgi:hypothetical protein
LEKRLVKRFNKAFKRRSSKCIELVVVSALGGDRLGGGTGGLGRET